MKISEIKREINTKLDKLNFIRLKELILWLKKSPDYLRLKKEDVQLQILDFFIDIWLQEKQNRDTFEMQGDIFYGVTSLEEIEDKYLAARFAILRLESGIPYEYCEEAVVRLIEYDYSGYALFSIIMKESKQYEENICKLAGVLKDRNELVRAIGILQRGLKEYPLSEKLLLELADCWLTAQQWKNAYECLKQIENPAVQIEEMIIELEKLISDEDI